MLIPIGSGVRTHAAQSDYPARPIRFVIPYPPGGATDAMARILAPKLASSMGQTWVVDNRVGAGGIVGHEVGATAQPDGYTVLLGDATVLTAVPTLYPKLSFNVLRDLQPITKFASAQYLLVVHPSVQASTLAEFIALAKSVPGKLNYSTSGVGSPSHLAAEMFKFKTGVNLVHVPYKGGGPAALALLAGEVQVLFGSVASTLPHVKSGKLKAFAVTGLKRSDVAPSLPTMAESGFPDFEVTNWYALLVPTKTPRPVLKRLYDEGVRVVRLPDVQEAFARLGLDVETSTNPEALVAVIRSETAGWAKVINAAGIRAE